MLLLQLKAFLLMQFPLFVTFRPTGRSVLLKCWGMLRNLWAFLSGQWWILANSLPLWVRITFHLINPAPVSKTIPSNKSIAWTCLSCCFLFHSSPLFFFYRCSSGGAFLSHRHAQHALFNIRVSLFPLLHLVFKAAVSLTWSKSRRTFVTIQYFLVFIIKQ